LDPLHELLLAVENGDDDDAEAAVARLASLAPEDLPQQIASLQAWLASPDVERRWWALRAATAIPGEPAQQMLLRGLGDSQASVRQCAALGLRLRPAALAAPALARALEDEDELAARLAADALAAVGEASVPILIEVLQHGQPAARRLAVRALAMIGDQRAIPALFAALDDDSLLIEYWANEGLERMGVGMSFFLPE
jgi:HEAT repeat protein